MDCVRYLRIFVTLVTNISSPTVSHGCSRFNAHLILKLGKSEGFDSCDRPNNLKLDSNCQFSARVTVEFDGWPRKTIEHFFYTTPSFVHHFKAIGEAKLELQSGNAQVGSKLVTFLSCGTLKFDGWSWKSIGHLFYTTLSCVHHFTGMGEFKLELQSGNPKFRSKSAIFSPVWPWNLKDVL